VASFFVSRIDNTAVDKLLEAINTLQSAVPPRQRPPSQLQDGLPPFSRRYSVLTFQSAVQSGRAGPAAAVGQHRDQEPQIFDVLYVEELIGPDTVNTCRTATLNAFRDHGKVQMTLLSGVDDAARLLSGLPELGIDLNA